jgi:Tuberculosis necrotizing toxin
MFPIGHMPVVSDRPARQLPPPPVEVDYAPGMRFEPGDHPQHHLVDSAQRLDELHAGAPAITPAEGLPADHPLVAVLAEGHDPLGGQHERDWDRRYLVRLGSVTAQGISSEGKEYAWPPCEVSPEGGTAPGEPEMLAEGTVIDRFGSPGGRVFSLDGTEFGRRSLPPETLHAGYHRYRVTRRLPVWRTISAPWFAQRGGAERYRTTYSAAELLALGYLADITGGDQ